LELVFFSRSSSQKAIKGAASKDNQILVNIIMYALWKPVKNSNLLSDNCVKCDLLVQSIIEQAIIVIFSSILQ